MTHPEELHRRSIVIDAHCDTALLTANDGYVLGERHDAHHLDLPRMKEGGITAQVFAIFIEPKYLPAQATRRALQVIDTIQRAIEANSNDMRLILHASDIMKAKTAGQVGAIIGLEGAEALEGDLGVLRMLHRLGVRNIGLTWNFRNQAADGVGEERTGGGLTTFGVSLVEEMNRLGIMIDIAHLAPAGVEDVLRISQAPIIASHANARAVCDHRRNLTDAQLEKIARNGGVVGVTFVPAFVDGNEDKTTIPHILDHVDHLVKVMGEDHVGLGSDFDGFFGEERTPGLEDVSRMPAITAGLVERGYSDAAIQRILGGNLLRVFKKVAG
jgi:membrane dipeptidase